MPAVLVKIYPVAVLVKLRPVPAVLVHRKPVPAVLVGRKREQLRNGVQRKMKCSRQ